MIIACKYIHKNVIIAIQNTFVGWVSINCVDRDSNCYVARDSN